MAGGGVVSDVCLLFGRKCQSFDLAARDNRPVAVPKALTPDDKLKIIQKHLPKGIAEKILAQKDKIEGELKQVTVICLR